jgi:hypothetical protein
MQMRRRHWWNGKWGRLARRDVVVYVDDETQKWTVEAREGGVEGDSRWWELNCEADAMQLVEGLTEPTVVDAWRELPTGRGSV